MTCARPDCNEPTAGKSKYCAKHRAEARQKWLENVRNSEQERAEKAEHFRKLWKLAREAAMKAGQEAVPTPMIVGTPTPDTFFAPEGEAKLDPGKPQYFVEDGVCGFAWVNVPGNSSFGRWLKKNGYGRKGYPKGIDVSIHEFGQSMQRKEAAARAMAEVLRKGGVKARSQSWMD